MRSRPFSMLFSLLLMLMLVAQCAYARLGETPRQCLERYGVEYKARYEEEKNMPGVYVMTFRKNGVQITVWIWKETCVTVFYNKVGDQSFTEAEVAVLLKANEEGSAGWGDFRDISEKFRRRDGKATGMFISKGKFLILSNVEYNEEKDSYLRKKMVEEAAAMRKRQEEKDAQETSYLKDF